MKRNFLGNAKNILNTELIAKKLQKTFDFYIFYFIFFVIKLKEEKIKFKMKIKMKSKIYEHCKTFIIVKLMEIQWK